MRVSVTRKRYRDGEHTPDCESLRPPVLNLDGLTWTTYVCTGCLPDELTQARAEAWDEGHTVGCGDQMYGSGTPNPYR